MVHELASKCSCKIKLLSLAFVSKNIYNINLTLGQQLRLIEKNVMITGENFSTYISVKKFRTLISFDLLITGSFLGK
jgi:hypothetical protein